MYVLESLLCILMSLIYSPWCKIIVYRGDYITLLIFPVHHVVYAMNNVIIFNEIFCCT